MSDSVRRVTRRERAAGLADGRPLLSGDLATVAWLTGLVIDVESGPSPFSAPPLVVVAPGGDVVAVASEDDAPTADAGVEVRSFPGFAVEDVDREAAATGAALELLGGARAIACDLASLPAPLVATLIRGGVELVDVAAALRAARAIKDPDELEGIKAAIALSDAGQAAARRGLEPGRSELELWGLVRGAMEREAGERVAVLADFVTGARTGDAGGPPGDRVLAEDDLLLADLVPRRGGWWGDSCATVAIGSVSDEVRHAHSAACEALERATELLRPGVIAGDIDATAREIVGAVDGGAYPHHTGHGLGRAWHEEPRIIPWSERRIEAGMVVALEPAVYGKGWGVRVERVVLVGEHGPEVLSGHDIAL